MNLPPIRPPLMPIKTPQKSNEIINQGKTLAVQKSFLKIGIA
jgi:hypothetical protein